jgi:hypothetical protein
MTGYGFRLFLSTGSPLYSGGWDLWTGTGSSPHGSYFTTTITTNIPTNIPNGLYVIVYTADTTNMYGEWNESDNSTHTCLVINVDC